MIQLATSWTQLKTLTSRFGKGLAYLTTDLWYEVFLVDPETGTIYLTRLARDGSSDQTDFETSFQPAATEYLSLEDGIADQWSKFRPVSDTGIPKIHGNVVLWDGANQTIITSPVTDGIATTGILGPDVIAIPYLFNGTTFDRQQNHVTATIQPAITLTESKPGVAQTNYNHRGINLFIVVTAISGVGASLTIAVQYQDPVTGNWVNSGTATPALIKPDTTLLQVTQNLSRLWRINAIVAGVSPSVTFSVGGAGIM